MKMKKKKKKKKLNRKLNSSANASARNRDHNFVRIHSKSKKQKYIQTINKALQQKLTDSFLPFAIISER
jgi:hypothetical protein